jgi:hypothetical protein
MEGYRMPLFKQGSILTKEMLECVREYEVNFSRAVYSGYKNGILRGCGVRGERGVLYVEKGLVLFDGEVLFVPDSVLVPPKSNAWHAVKIRVSEMSEETDYQFRKLEVVATDQIEKEEGTIEICRVRLQQGALIRSDYRNFADLNTEYDTVNVLYAQWSAFEQESISPEILKMFASDAVKNQLSNPFDISFVQSILARNGETLPRAQVQFYISSRLGEAYGDLNNLEIYTQLASILRQIKTGRAAEKSARTERRIIVD